MIDFEHQIHRFLRRERPLFRRWIQDNGSDKLLSVKDSVSDEPHIYQRTLFAQNHAYLELSNDGWDNHWVSAMIPLMMVPFAFLIVLFWFGVCVQPLAFGSMSFFGMPYPSYDPAGDSGAVFGSWFVFTPLVIFLLWAYRGMPSAYGIAVYFTMPRLRVRFNRLTRKVYIVRPWYCGGNAVWDWERIQINLTPYVHYGKSDQRGASVFLYHPPLDPSNLQDKAEDLVMVGPDMSRLEEWAVPGAQAYWEYIRRFMEHSPLPSAQDTLQDTGPQDASTYCGLPSWRAYRLEHPERSFGETCIHMLCQSTCYWLRFPPHWASDSGIGEPEDKPVEAGAFFTFLIHRQQGRITQAQWELAGKRGWTVKGGKL